MSRKHMACCRWAWPIRHGINFVEYLWLSWALPRDLKDNEASFSMILTVLLNLQVAQMPRYGDLAILVMTTDRWQTIKTDCFTRAGNYIFKQQDFYEVLCRDASCLLFYHSCFCAFWSYHPYLVMQFFSAFCTCIIHCICAASLRPSSPIHILPWELQPLIENVVRDFNVVGVVASRMTLIYLK